MPKCGNCNTHLTEAYVKVFGDNDDEVQACYSCKTRRVDKEEMQGGL